MNAIRQKISDECFEAGRKESGIYTLTVPTGGGKTLSSMRYALEHSERTNKERIIFVLPYTTIIEQNAKVIREVLGESCDLLEHHSNVTEDDKRMLDSLGEERDYRLLTERWENRIVFTTMVQFLNTFYGKGTRDMRRMHHLLNAVIIFDEIQTVPVKCMDLFNGAINFLNRVGNTSTILCTATQPDFSNISKDISEYVEEIIDDAYELGNKRCMYYKKMYNGWTIILTMPLNRIFMSDNSYIVYFLLAVWSILFIILTI